MAQQERSRIIGQPQPLRVEDPTAILQKFQRTTNRFVEVVPGNHAHIQIKHGGKLHRVDFASTVDDLVEAKKLDDDAFGNHHGVSLQELQDISRNGHVLLLRDAMGGLVGVSEVITDPTPDHPELAADLAADEVYCYGTAVMPGEEGKGYTQVLYKAQEVLARTLLYKDSDGVREFNKRRMTLTVRPENATAIRTRMHSGFQIVGHEDVSGPINGGGARFVMEKSLTSEPLPFYPDKQSKRVQEGATKIVTHANIDLVLQDKPIEIAVPILTGDVVDLTAQQIAMEALDAGYVGTGLLRPEEWGDAEQSLLVFQKKDSPPITEHLTLPPHVRNDYGRLREVIVSNSPFSAGVDVGNYINAVSNANAGNVDSIAIRLEHEALVAALESVGANVIRTGAFATKDTDGRTGGLFTRDPGFVLGDTLVTGKMFREKRRYETNGMRRAAEGYNLTDLADPEGDASIEGGDIIPLGPTEVLVGIGQRTNEAGYQKLIETFPDINFIGVPHSDLHLDVLFTVVGEKKVLADVTQLPGELFEWLHGKGYDVVIADPEEQVPLGTNVLAVDNNKVIAVAENPNTNARLREAGVEVIEVSMPNIIKEGGGPRCLTCPTNRD